MQLNRRRFLGGVGATVVTGLAGCTDKLPKDAVKDMPAPTRGPDDAPATVELFEDFGCPHCRAFNANILPKLVANYASTGKAQIEFHDYPLPVSQFSWAAAMCARSVQDRAGNEAFWTYEKFIFDNQDKLGWPLLREAANELDLDGPAVVEDAKNNKYRPVVQNDHDYGASLGVRGTPSVFVAGELITPPQGGTYDDYYRAIGRAIEKHQ